ncbi:regulatory protein, Fis family [Desulfacinum hydrothermale DSM 13146]|uniref:Regulatory protein, Fis family n=1 Tax=Desulfacinum hydrothermale DSM 13146 TaxID=1121390 RepID=A0A1W1X9J4_9BACT|nr:helix-turn-helix domain-containing protein [Desulfacinum hydrothermale]SMC20517.1 regulatory protein, Fis family [Desulfacinum hydrothermale DSM 13146]
MVPPVLPEFLELLTQLEPSAQRWAALAKALLDYLPQTPLAREAVDLTALVERSLKESLSRPDPLDPAPLQVDVDLPRQPTTILACPGPLLRAVRALLTNAVEAVQETPGKRPARISIAWGTAGASARILVEDSGPGIPSHLVEDVPLLAAAFMKRFSDEYGRDFQRISPAAVERMQAYSWPGNVRELENTIARAVALQAGPTLEDWHLPFPEEPREPSCPHQDPEPLSLREVEQRHIHKMLQRLQWNISQTARVLEIDRTTLHKKIKRYGLKPSGRPDGGLSPPLWCIATPSPPSLAPWTAAQNGRPLGMPSCGVFPHPWASPPSPSLPICRPWTADARPHPLSPGPF